MAKLNIENRGLREALEKIRNQSAAPCECERIAREVLAGGQRVRESRCEMGRHIEAMKNHTDLWPWYWLSYGEKCYAFAVVEAYQAKEEDPLPPPGSELILHEDKEGVWVGKNGTEMIINAEIASIEEQSGDTVCRFIAAAHAHFMGREHVQESGCPRCDGRGWVFEPSHMPDCMSGICDCEAAGCLTPEKEPCPECGVGAHEQEAVCVWTCHGNEFDDDDDVWETSCGEAYCFIDGGTFADNLVRFCSFCGKPVKGVDKKIEHDTESRLQGGGE